MWYNHCKNPIKEYLNVHKKKISWEYIHEILLNKKFIEHYIQCDFIFVNIYIWNISPQND